MAPTPHAHATRQEYEPDMSFYLWFYILCKYKRQIYAFSHDKTVDVKIAAKNVHLSTVSLS